MKISYYDVILKRIRESDKELIRYWRNHEKISSKMEFREFISPEMHEKWFTKMNDYKKAFAFIIEYQNTSSGIIFNTNAAEHSEGGMFIWDDKCLDTQIPVLVSIILTDINFYLLGNKFSYIRILKDNFNSIEFNKRFGYKLLKSNDSEYNQRYFLSEDEYQAHAKSIKKYIAEFYGYCDKATLIVEKEDLSNGLYDSYVNTYQTNPYSQKHFKLEMPN